jgi:hypothetical protein
LNSGPSPIAATTRRAGHRADAFDLRYALAGFTVAKNLFDLLVERGNRSCPVRNRDTSVDGITMNS